MEGGLATLDQALQSFLEKGSFSENIPMEEILEAGAEVETLSKDVGKNQLDMDHWDGSFRSLVFTDMRQAIVDGVTTLGQASFNVWQPADLQVRINGIRVFKGDEEGVPNTFRVTTEILVQQAGLTGYSSAVGIYYPDSEVENRVIIEFNKLKLEPADSTPNKLEQWKALLKKGNPFMGEDGVAIFELPQAPQGAQDLVYMSVDVQIIKGSYGSLPKGNYGSLIMLERQK